MLNEVLQGITMRNPLGPLSAAWHVRAKRNQEPGATLAETERGMTIVQSPKVDLAFAKVWGWS